MGFGEEHEELKRQLPPEPLRTEFDELKPKPGPWLPDDLKEK